MNDIAIRAHGFGASGHVRANLTVSVGKTIAQAVRSALPGITRDELRNVRVTLSEGGQRSVVRPEVWARLKPRAGVTVLIEVIPAGDAMRTVLQLLIAFAAFAIGNYVVSAFALEGLAAVGVKTGIALGLAPVGTLQVGFPS